MPERRYGQGPRFPAAVSDQASPEVRPPVAATPAAAPWPLGSSVQLAQRLPYLKTADPMPMLRPGDLVDAEEIGEVVAVRPQALVAVRFRRGTFLIDGQALQAPVTAT